MRPIAQVAHSGVIAATTLIAFAVILLAMASALASRPLYRLLEGYTLPWKIHLMLLRKQARQWKVLRRQLQRAEGRPKLRHQYSLIQEQLSDYPSDRRDLLPTRLGNAFKAMEDYGYDRFRLDSQTLWYELHSVLPARLRKDSEDARAGVDFFGALLAHLVALAVIGCLIAITEGSALAFLVAVASCVLTRPTYSAAVKNMTDWRFSVQALINVGRPNLAKALGYSLPTTLDKEGKFWLAWFELVNYGESERLRQQDSLRVDQRNDTISSGTDDDRP